MWWRPAGYLWLAPAAIAAGIPLALDPGGYFIFLPAKWTLATVLVASGLAFLILAGRPLARSPLLTAWGALLLVFTTASLLGVGGLTSWIGYPGRYLGVAAWLTFFGAFVLGASLRDPAERALVVRTAVAASILVSTYALLQAEGIDPLEWSAEIDVSRTRSTLGNAAFLGAYLALIVPLAGRLALARSEPLAMRALFGAGAFLGSIALLTTETRGAWLGALGGVAVIIVLELPRLRARPVGTAALLAVGLLAIVLLATVSPSASRIRSIADLSAETSRGRLTQWHRTLDLIAERPLLGWGPETYAFTFPRAIDPEFERTVGRDVVPDRAHNVFLDIASAAGALGVAAYLVVLGLLAWAVAGIRDRDAATVGIAGGCAAYVGQLQFSFPLADLDTVFWLLAGLLLAAAGPGSKLLSRRWALMPLLAAVLFAVWGAMDLAADRTLRRSLDTEAAGAFAEAQRLADRAADLAPGRVQYLQAAGRLHRRVGELSGRAADFERGLEAVDDARRLMPRDLELRLDRADLLLAWGETGDDPRLVQRAAAGYEGILELDPASSRAHLKLGVAYVQLGRPEEAEKEWLSAASLSPRSPGPLVNLGFLYEQQGRDEEAVRALRAALALDPANASARTALRRLAVGESALRRFVAAWPAAESELEGTISGAGSARLIQTVGFLREGGVVRTTLSGVSADGSSVLTGTVALQFADGGLLELTVRARVERGLVQAEPAAVSTLLSRWERLRIEAFGARTRGVILSRSGKLLARGPRRSRVLSRPALGPAVSLIDEALDARLAGSLGRRLLAGDPPRVLAESAPADGEDVVTSLDDAAQAAAEETLGTAPGALVAVDPRSGGIRALVSNPEPQAPRRSPAISAYSPGSAFKIVTAAAALESGILQPSEVVPCPARATVEERQITNFGNVGYGPITFEKAFALSCNTAFSQIGVAVGTVRLLRTAERLGFRLGELEGPGTISVPRSRGELAVWSFGAAGSLTSPVLLAGLGSTVARGGTSVSPGWTDRVDPGRRVLRESTTAALVTMMEEVVERGTGRNAAVPGARIAGKTGTADPRRPGSQSDAWFVALAPARETRVVAVGFLPSAGVGGDLAASLVREFLIESADVWR